MGNPARELAEILDGWRVVPERGSIQTLRGVTGGGGSTDEWRRVVHAAELLHRVDEYLVAMEAAGTRVAHYQRAFPGWARAVFQPEHPWGNGQPRALEVIDQSLVDRLEALADVIDATAPAIELSPERRTASLLAIDDVMSVLNDPATRLTPPQRRYVFELITSVRRVFEESETLGDVDMIRRVHELIGVLTMMAETLAEDPATKTLAKKLAAAAKRIAPYARFGAGLASGSIDVAANLLQITESFSS